MDDRKSARLMACGKQRRYLLPFVDASLTGLGGRSICSCCLLTFIIGFIIDREHIFNLKHVTVAQADVVHDTTCDDDFWDAFSLRHVEVVQTSKTTFQ